MQRLMSVQVTEVYVCRDIHRQEVMLSFGHAYLSTYVGICICIPTYIHTSLAVCFRAPA